MKLFHEYESKYFELISYILLRYEEFNDEDIDKLHNEMINGEYDFSIMEDLFSKKQGKEVLFSYENGRYRPLLNKKMPVRNTDIELQAAYAMLYDPYVGYFINDETVKKLRSILQKIQPEFDMNDIIIKNQFEEGARTAINSSGRAIISIVTEAVKNHRAIIFDNIKPGVYEYRDSKVFPIRIEYSFLNDQFRMIAFDPVSGMFIKSVLNTMSNIRISDKRIEDLELEYRKFVKRELRTVVLDIDPVQHVIERCFRIFSYYERTAEFDREADIYRLSIKYHRADEAELVRDILSLGSSVTVINPSEMQHKILERIKRSAEMYE